MTRVLRVAGRLLGLALVLFLCAPAPAFEAKDLVVGCLFQAYRYGNYAAGERLLSYLEGLAPTETRQSPEFGVVLGLELVTKVAEGQYSTAFAIARTIQPDAPPMLRYAANVALAVGGYRAGQPELTDKYLPEAMAYASAHPEMTNDLFLQKSLAFQRELERNPNLPLQNALRLHDEAFACLAAYQPGPFDASGREIWEGAGFWLRWMSLASENPRVGEELKQRFAADRRLLSQFTQRTLSDTSLLGFNPQYIVGEADFSLTEAESWLARGQLDRAAGCIDSAEQVFMKTWTVTSDSLDQRNRQLIEAARKAGGLPANLPLEYSLLDGDLSLLKSRADTLRARVLLAGPTPDAQRVNGLLRSAAAAQQAARRGQGFLGLQDVRWTQLQAWTSLRAPGWENQTVELAHASLKECRELGFRPGEITALTYLGQAKKDVSTLQEAVKLIETYVQDSGDVSLRNTFQRAYNLLTELQIDRGQAQAAAETLGRSQQLDAVALSKNLPAVEALRGKQEALESELTSRKGLGQDTKVVEELIAKTKAEFYTELLNIKRDNPQYESMLAIRPVNFSKLQKQIPANTCVVQYFPASGFLYIFVATNQDLKIHKVAVTDERLTSLITSYRQTLTKTRMDGPEASQLYELLIKPIEADMASKEVLAFIPTSTLNYLPLQALKAPDGRYLIEKKQCVSIVKSSDLESLASPPTAAKGGVLALGNPDGSLPGAAEEARAITALFPGSKAWLGKDATAGRLAATKNASYLHLATHGVLDARDSSGSYLLVADGDQHLKVPQIFDLKLDGVRLVTLSACQTGVGKSDTAAGSELTTLAFAFSVAGTNSVVASLWSISDASTRELMTTFYKGLKAGQPISQALQQAELKLLKDPRYKSPFYWAPFVLLGDWR